jgi:hypothetical protein
MAPAAMRMPMIIADIDRILPVRYPIANARIMHMPAFRLTIHSWGTLPAHSAGTSPPNAENMGASTASWIARESTQSSM